MQNEFKFGTHGHALAENRQRLADIIISLRGMNLADGSAHRQEAIDAVSKIFKGLQHSILHEAEFHPSDIA